MVVLSKYFIRSCFFSVDVRDFQALQRARRLGSSARGERRPNCHRKHMLYSKSVRRNDSF